MKTIEKLVKIGLEETHKMLGDEIIKSPYYDDCYAHNSLQDIEEDKVFKFSLSADDEPFDMENFKLGDETPFKYCALVNIDPYTGEVTRDYEHSRLPASEK